MVETKYVIDDILNAIVDEKPVDLQAAINSVMVDKAHDQISSMKMQLMQDMLSDGEEGDTEEVEDEVVVEVPEDEAEDEEDEGTEELDADDLFNDESEEEETDNQG